MAFKAMTEGLDLKIEHHGEVCGYLAHAYRVALTRGSGEAAAFLLECYTGMNHTRAHLRARREDLMQAARVLLEPGHLMGQAVQAAVQAMGPAAAAAAPAAGAPDP
jgi:hypothetical protein